SWRETCALFDQSHHMTDLYLEGPDALKLISALGVNTFTNFRVDTAKQFVACNHDGYVIGDAILFHLAPNSFVLVGRPPALNWVQYNLETGNYNARAERDERSFVNKTGGRRVYRYQVQGPNAKKVMEKVTGKPVPEIKFFNMNVFDIAGCKVRALRHGMVGQPGWEIFGPWADADKVRDAIVEAGREFGIRKVGARTYPTSTLESGWIPSPLPAVYTGDAMKPYREWLKGTSYEATASLGGSFVAKNIESYYLTPYDLGYGGFVRFDHDFVGRAALEKIAKKPKRQKVTLVWNGDDVDKVFSRLFHAGKFTKYIDLPLANYSTLPFDKIVKGGKTVGVSTYTGYSFNERAMLSLACIDVKHAKPGTKVAVVWGEDGGGTKKPTVERHNQATIRATVQPAPYGETARVAYRPK
ncbi:MAG TPA: aminomethyl transferase family protein, partial [Gammaproteobacteria bacterium]